MKNIFGLSTKDFATLKKLNTPIKIQDFLDQMPANFEKKGETIMSPMRALREGKAHCLEGAFIAALALWIQGEEPLILHLEATPNDADHAVTLYKRNGLWGAISKTNHATIRFRDPVYKNFRELSMSYFHEWFMDKNGKKTMRRFGAKALNLKKFGVKWVTEEKDLKEISDVLNDLPHEKTIPEKNIKYLRKADPMEMKAGTLTQWKREDPRT